MFLTAVIDFTSAYVTQFSINTNQDYFIPHVSQIALQFIVRHWRDMSTSNPKQFVKRMKHVCFTFTVS